jgi:transcriptional regulator with XRE-family HTH domain
MTLSDQLKAWRGVDDAADNRGIISQREAAELIGVPHKTYIDWEQGRRIPRGLTLIAIEKIISKPLRVKKLPPGPARKEEPTTTERTGDSRGRRTKKEQHEKKSSPYRPRRRHP